MTMPAALLRLDEEVPSHPVASGGSTREDDESDGPFTKRRGALHSKYVHEDRQDRLVTVQRLRNFIQVSSNICANNRGHIQTIEENAKIEHSYVKDTRRAQADQMLDLFEPSYNESRSIMQEVGRVDLDSESYGFLIRARHEDSPTARHSSPEKAVREMSPPPSSPASLMRLDTMSLGSNSRSPESVLAEGIFLDLDSLEQVLDEEIWLDLGHDHDLENVAPAPAPSPTAYFLDAMKQGYSHQPLPVVHEFDESANEDAEDDNVIANWTARQTPIRFHQIINIEEEPLPVLLEEECNEATSGDDEADSQDCSKEVDKSMQSNYTGKPHRRHTQWS